MELSSAFTQCGFRGQWIQQSGYFYFIRSFKRAGASNWVTVVTSNLPITWTVPCSKKGICMSSLQKSLLTINPTTNRYFLLVCKLKAIILI
ncbi:hypothetical protein OESDEN_00131 [Oesophagostomum dentatum]|uniref:Uncharacterized protein n=1 Tax=Oesophagostomum dentatum TaxID=61180 RepID=A0A0B1TVE3_OESDE|nr:hypothetical protein OESDEN_00131 [Oesophagostomum dentatum]